ncbi:hypothetical protein C7999DRAFT_28957 [Corynascus novoguineensis]|uniref:Uncharacterized protein n=1 Tax=Corynascus novoguineensis TaxID=1126955 RepID=A0AAN7HMK3_9PEZI|nr:hypothetical protein C7999DRAFT_28957 [Corynascus novoguineensis]
MPTYYSPPPTPSTTSSSAPYRNRSNSFSHSTSTSRGTTNTTATSSSSSRSRPSISAGGVTHEGTAAGAHKKPPYLFLGSIAAASLLAHKYWPKGYPYSEKEDWELSDLALRAKQRRLAEKAEKAEKAAAATSGRQAAAGGSRHRRGRGRCCCCDAEYGGDCCPYDGGAEGLLSVDGDGRRGRSPYRPITNGGYGHYFKYDDLGWDGAGGRLRSWTGRRDRSRARNDRDWVHGASGYLEPLYRRDSSCKRVGPPTTTAGHQHLAITDQYLLENSSSATGVSRAGLGHYSDRSLSNVGSLAWGSTQLRYHDDDDHPGEAVYGYRDIPARPRRASFDLSGDKRYGEGYDWYR